MICGTSLFEVGSPKPIPESKPSNSINFKKFIPLKIHILVGIPILILLILGAGYSLGYFDNELNRFSSPDVVPIQVADPVVISSGETDSKCGPGTIFDSESNSCILG